MSDLVLGTMYFGTRTDHATSYALLDRFVEAGGRVVDTANCYAFWANPTGHGGQSESLIGEWLRENPGIRDHVEIATKVGVEPVDGGGVEGLSADVVRRGAAASLARLGLDRVDVFWAHARDHGTPIEETVEAMGALVAEGRATRLGLSNHPTWLVERARAHAQTLGLEPITALQLSTSYVEARPGAAVEGKDHRFGWVTEETRDFVEQHPEVEVWAYSPLIQGAFDRADRPFPTAYDHPGTTARLAALADVAGRLGVAPSVVVLAWLVRKGISPIIGVSSVEQLESALAAGDLALDDEQLAQLDEPA
jgi:aryl-alcohol dehydrogenase-like predicted oxidoreductase